jgi:hypothetical protein
LEQEVNEMGKVAVESE